MNIYIHVDESEHFVRDRRGGVRKQSRVELDVWKRWKARTLFSDVLPKSPCPCRSRVGFVSAISFFQSVEEANGALRRHPGQQSRRTSLVKSDLCDIASQTGGVTDALIEDETPGLVDEGAMSDLVVEFEEARVLIPQEDRIRK